MYMILPNKTVQHCDNPNMDAKRKRKVKDINTEKTALSMPIVGEKVRHEKQCKINGVKNLHQYCTTVIHTVFTGWAVYVLFLC